MINAKVIADSANEFGNRITTMVVTMPRYILAEFNTHRMFSRNSASSRAIPFKKMVESVKNNPFIPIAWQKDHTGMQGTEYFQHTDPYGTSGLTMPKVIEMQWLEQRDNAIKTATELNEQLRVTKQLVNRLLEPFMWHTVIITATEFENFFALRCPQYNFELDDVNDITVRSRKDMYNKFPHQKDVLDGLSDLDWLNRNAGQADIHMMALAEAMWDALNESTPKQLKAGEWHIPFGDQIDYVGQAYYNVAKQFINDDNKDDVDVLAIKIATARCARVSYTVVGEEDKPANYENDIKLHDRLAASGHWSPFEHCAQCMSQDEYEGSGFTDSHNEEHFGWSGNFRGFTQYRKTFANENIAK